MDTPSDLEPPDRSPRLSWEAIAALAAVVAALVAALTLWDPDGDSEPVTPGPACSNLGNNNVIEDCSVEFERNVGSDPSEEQARSEAERYAGVEPAGDGPWPFFVIGTSDGLKVRTSGEADGQQIGSADDSTLVYVDCRTHTGFEPQVLEDRDRADDKWLRIRWPNTVPTNEFFESAPDDRFTGYVYEGFVLPAGHSGDIPDC